MCVCWCIEYVGLLVKWKLDFGQYVQVCDYVVFECGQVVVVFEVIDDVVLCMLVCYVDDLCGQLFEVGFDEVEIVDVVFVMCIEVG